MKVTRYFSQDKGKAFAFQESLNKAEIPTNGKIKKWRVAVRVKDRVIFDIDNHDITNVKSIIQYCRNLFIDH